MISMLIEQNTKYEFVDKKNIVLDKDKFQKLLKRELIGTIIHFSNSNGKSPKVLEVGCGAGFFLKDVKNLCVSIMGVDLQDIFDYRLLKSDKVSFVRGDATKLPFRDCEFDIAFSMDVIEHVEDSLSFLVESKRCLKENGLIIIGTPNYSRLSMLIHNMLNLRKWPYCVGVDSVLGDVMHVREYTKQQLTDLVGKAGFNIHMYKPLWLGLFRPHVGVEYPKIMKKQCQFHYVIGKK